MANPDKFNTTFDEWIESEGKLAPFMIDVRVLRTVAGYFYHTGAAHALNDAREIVKETAVGESE